MKNASIVGACMVLAAAALWGTTGTAQAFMPAHTSPYWVGTLRMAIATLFFAAFIAWRRRGGDRSTLALPATAWRWVLLAGLCMAGYNLSFFAGVKATGIAIGTAVAVGSGPAWAGLLQSLVSRRPPAPVWWVGTLLAIGGGCLMVMPASASGLQTDPAGLALCLASGFCYAVYTLVSQRLVRHSPPATVTLWVFGVASAAAIPVALLVSGPFSASPSGWAIVAYLGLVSTGVSYLLFSHALRRISGASGVTLALAEPVTAFALALLVVHERPAPAAFAGLALVLSGLVIVVWTEARSGGRGPR
ncbi:EamA family transporter [Variovorax sp. RKNM96]|uniref:DMT family transporter n=1 Tax=Variovorax sp. RKNM96 TaxID=2681552 RepID=UPI00197E4CE9|nr:EamA family transporter [Variovorax sp. RKNM96]QSI30243.1 EamA family transporter [Variovorax sp. RKNM96]